MTDTKPTHDAGAVPAVDTSAEASTQQIIDRIAHIRHVYGSADRDAAMLDALLSRAKAAEAEVARLRDENTWLRKGLQCDPEGYRIGWSRAAAAEACADRLSAELADMKAVSGRWMDRAEAAEAEVARLREALAEVADRDFIWGALDNVHDAETTLDDYADAVSRAQHAAIAALREGGAA